MGLKVPHASGGAGNVFLPAAPLRRLSLKELNEHLRTLIPSERWPADVPLMVEVWETNVVENASIQTWIPPVAEGEPILEGVFSQIIAGDNGRFVGCIPLSLPEQLYGQLVAATSLLTLLFQQLGYVGRCSFDFLLVGEDVETARIEFLECNGRWGGTSVPMTLVNRIFGDWKTQPFAAISTDNAIPVGMTFADILAALRLDLFRRTTESGQSTGWLIPFNPGRLSDFRGLNWIVLGEDVDQVKERLCHDLPARLSSLKFSQSTPAPPGVLNRTDNVASRAARATGDER